MRCSFSPIQCVRHVAIITGVSFIVGSAIAADAPAPALMPVPAELRQSEGRLPIGKDLTVAIRGHDDPRLRAGLRRALRRIEERTGLTFAREATGDPANATLVIDCGGSGNEVPVLGEDESYTLDINPTQATLRAPATVGALRGLETFVQLLTSDADGWFLPAVSIRDEPRFAWRGLMLDVARHWQPMDVVKRTLDGMAAVKLNVLHFHLTEDQGFRIESKKFPRLHEMGSDGQYFTQDEIREIIAYAAERGIRVVPEFDIPGHATSWLVGHPELGSAPGPYEIERRWGIFNPTLDPTNEDVYILLDGFLGEMAALFPDPYLHIGGDEVNGKHWDANPQIQAFIKEKGLKDNAGLQAHFNRRVQAILTKYGKRMVGWDEIFHPDLPKDAVVHSWRGQKSLAEAARQGYSGILSNGYYIDLSKPASDHYLNDPLPADTTLTAEEQERILGGEATMWAEWVTPETIDSRIWPRTAAIAERLWSPRDVRDVDAMYRRLAFVSRRLEEFGLTHVSYIDPMLRRLAGDNATPEDLQALRVIADLVEPVKEYRRGGQQRGTTQFTPLTGFVDAARPDSTPSRELSREVDLAVFERNTDSLAAIDTALRAWQTAATELRSGAATRSPRVRALTPLFDRLDAACAIGLDAVAKLRETSGADESWRTEKLAALAKAAEPHDACELPIIPSLRLLVAAASEKSKRATMTPDEWRIHVEALANPLKKQAAPAH
jgi:hexosaminidase